MTNRGLQDVKNVALAQTRGQRGETSCGHSSTAGRATPPCETTESCPMAAFGGPQRDPFMLPTPRLGCSAASSLTCPLELLIKQQGGLFIATRASYLMNSCSVELSQVGAALPSRQEARRVATLRPCLWRGVSRTTCHACRQAGSARMVQGDKGDWSPAGIAQPAAVPLQ